ncbi:ABC transporter ATP-binding protein [Sulfitobacter sp. S190]|uniref:ABC transporter ATP-binding protein n=1 Tax=Sulfitobacter sp. S190 TaxID=2867022 RepID=UPI0021A26144|nr:sn-glycerol-3-phosphate ABC transporter ATP-binding protein UgpC [Sulfitobacter sp. S190]UWR21877.1 sn-glycerol-3-phosphate ABC transporter ATP-binding protein UgpC [Sulfitobacter sp. S190]
MADLKLHALRKSYGDVDVIHGIDMAIASGEFCVFVGPSGCGKSTLLRMIAGLESVTGGTVSIDGDVVNGVPAAQRGLAMVFQSYALYPHMSVRQNLSFGLENLSMDRAEISRRVNEAARMLQIEELMDRRPAALSGGQRQRIAIGRAVVREPKIFLFDEPLSNLDAELRVAMRAEITDLHARLGNTMIYVTHDQVEAMTMADKIAVLRKGVVEQFGRPLDLFNAPRNRFVAGFIGSPAMNFAKGIVEGRAVTLDSGAVVALPEGGFDTKPGQRVELGVRASHMDITEDGPIEMKVNTVEQLGAESYVYGSLSDHARFTLHQLGQVDVAAGTTIRLTPRAPMLHLFDLETGVSLKSGIA